MEIAYTARNTFDPSYGDSWKKYIEWSKLIQLEELISLDSGLNEETFEADLNSNETWDNSVNLDSPQFANIYTSKEYILSKIPDNTKYNLLAVLFSPTEECKNINLKDFEFIGYDLLDQDYRTSALTNYGGFEESFNNSEINKNGLIDSFARAIEVRDNLLKFNEDEDHADTNVCAIWRHTKIGKT